MKSSFRLLLILTSISFFIACNATKPLSSAMKVAKNDMFNYRVTQNTDMQISIMGQNMSTSGKQETDYSFKVTEVLPNGDFKTAVTIDRVALNQKVPMTGEIDYDSADPNGSQNASLKSMGELVGKSFTVSYNKNGKITKTEGIDKIVGDLADGIEGQAGQQIISRMGTAGIENTLKNLSGFIQGSPKVGDTWTTNSIANGIVDLDMEQTFTLKERKDGKLFIDIVGTAKTASNESGLSFQGMDIGYDLTGPITGTVVVDEATGWAISSEIVPNLKGKMILKGGPFGDMNANAAMQLGIVAVRK